MSKLYNSSETSFLNNHVHNFFLNIFIRILFPSLYILIKNNPSSNLSSLPGEFIDHIINNKLSHTLIQSFLHNLFITFLQHCILIDPFHNNKHFPHFLHVLINGLSCDLFQICVCEFVYSVE